MVTTTHSPSSLNGHADFAKLYGPIKTFHSWLHFSEHSGTFWTAVEEIPPKNQLSALLFFLF